MNRHSRAENGWRLSVLIAVVGIFAGILAGSGGHAYATIFGGCGQQDYCSSYANKTCNACGTGFVTCSYRVLATGGAYGIDTSANYIFNGVNDQQLEYCATIDGCDTNDTQCPGNPTKNVCVANNDPYNVDSYATGVFTQNECDE